MNILFLPLTLLIYLLSVRLYLKLGWSLLNPVLVTMIVMIIVLLVADIPYDHYLEGNQILVELLGPTVVALGVPLYTQLHSMREMLIPILICVISASLLVIVSSLVLALLIGAGKLVALSLVSKSVTTPIAILVTEHIGGEPALAVTGVMVAGFLGAMFGMPWFRMVGVHSSAAQGLAMGTASHALGTARMVEEGVEPSAYSAIAMVLSASLTAVLAPVLVPWILALF